MTRTTNNRRRRQRGLTSLEMTIAGGITMMFFYGVCGAVDRLTDHADEGREVVRATGDNFRATRRMFNRLMSTAVADAVEDVQIFDAGARVQDIDPETKAPTVAQGAVARVVANLGSRLTKGRVVKNTRVIELRRDNEDVNRDGRRDQLIMVLSPDQPYPRSKVVANNVADVKFTKEGLLLKVGVFTYASRRDAQRHRRIEAADVTATFTTTTKPAEETVNTSRVVRTQHDGILVRLGKQK